jgi:hypothetical protein
MGNPNLEQRRHDARRHLAQAQVLLQCAAIEAYDLPILQHVKIATEAIQQFCSALDAIAAAELEEAVT